MASLTDIRNGLDARLATIAGLRHSPTWPAQVTPPMAWIKPVSMTERSSYGGERVPSFEVWLVAAAGSLPFDAAQAALDPFLDESGTQSIIAALEGDHTLGGLVSGLLITWSDYGTHEINGAEYFGAKFLVTVEP